MKNNTEYTCEVRPNGKAYSGNFPDLPGSEFEARSSEQAAELARTVFDRWMTKASEHRWAIPSPGDCEKVNGVVRIRAPKSLHRSLLGLCQARGITLTSLVRSILAVGASTAISAGTVMELSCGVKGADIPLALPGSRRSNQTGLKADGIWTQNLPRPLHFQLQWLAECEGISLSLLCLLIITRVMLQADVVSDQVSYLKVANC